MKLSLPTNTFSFFKFITGTIFLALATLFHSIAGYSFIIALAVGKAHSLGAWIAMWRAGKLNWKYIWWMFTISIIVAFWGLKVVSSLELLSFVTYTLFSFHFLFDEFDLQEEERSFSNILSSLSPSLLMFLFILQDFLKLTLPLNIFVAIALTFFIVELIFIHTINWFFLHTKILSLFILIAIATHVSSGSVLSVFLIFHYSFWFIYPVYKLHKYRPEERDNFIMILILIVSTSVYFALTRNSYGGDVFNLAVRAFLIGTIIHILSTAPFAYFLGLPKKYHPKQNPSKT